MGMEILVFLQTTLPLKMIRIIIFAFILALSTCEHSKNIKFEKFIFHTSMCFGTCPVYHLEVNNEKELKLHAEHVFPKTYDFQSLLEPDTAKTGYFRGLVNDTTFNKLMSELNTIGLDTLNFNNINCCDGSLITIIVYYNGKRKFLQSMFPPDNAYKLISTLYEICEANSNKKTNEKFVIEGEKESK